MKFSHPECFHLEFSDTEFSNPEFSYPEFSDPEFSDSEFFRSGVFRSRVFWSRVFKSEVLSLFWPRVFCPPCSISFRTCMCFLTTVLQGPLSPWSQCCWARMFFMTIVLQGPLSPWSQCFGAQIFYDNSVAGHLVERLTGPEFEFESGRKFASAMVWKWSNGVDYRWHTLWF